MGDLSRNLSRHEFACRCGCGYNTADTELVVVLQDVRDHFERPVMPNSGTRCPRYNERVGGAPDSEHIRAKAMDFRVLGIPASRVADFLEEKYPDKLIKKVFYF